MQVSLIAAMSSTGVIGYQNKLPWSLKSELKYFRQMTLGKPIVMGRKTFDSIGQKPLPDRLNIVVTSDFEFKSEQCMIAHGPEQALQLAEPAEEVMIIGGRQIYSLFLPLATRIYLSIIEGDYTGDTYFPLKDFEGWRLVSEKPMEGFMARVFER